MVKKKSIIRPEKEVDLLNKIRKAVLSGNYQETEHAKHRAKERGIIGSDYEYVLKTGSHEPSKDKFDNNYREWNYAIRGKTIDKKELRIIVTIEDDGLLLITVIDLNLEDE